MKTEKGNGIVPAMGRREQRIWGKASPWSAVGAVAGRQLGALAGESRSRLSLIRSSWAALVGDRLAERLEAVSIDGTRLVVRASSRAWATAAAALEDQILDRIGDQIPGGRPSGLVIRDGEKR